MPKTAKELERLILADGWKFHRTYTHPIKSGIVTIPFHTGDLKIKTERSILKQAGLLSK